MNTGLTRLYYHRHPDLTFCTHMCPFTRIKRGSKDIHCFGLWTLRYPCMVRILVALLIFAPVFIIP
jgi:hypothetical protein